MAPSRRSSNGRSPLVNQQRQITSFFTKSSSSPSPSPSPASVVSKSKPSVVSKSKPKQNPNPSPKSTPCLSASSSPTTPSPLQTKRSKPLLVIGPSQSPSPPAKKSPGDEVIGKRIRVYWPLDQSWYEGCVKSFNKISGQHLVQYDDAEEESLDLSKEKVEWIDEPVKKFRRLRRISVIEDENEEENVEVLESGGDDSADEDWGKNVEKEVIEDVSEDMDLDEEDDGVESAKKTLVKKSEQKKRKNDGGEKLGYSKKSKNCADASRTKLVELTNNNDSK